MLKDSCKIYGVALLLAVLGVSCRRLECGDGGSDVAAARKKLNEAADFLSRQCKVPPRLVYGGAALLGVVATVYLAKQAAIPFVVGTAFGFGNYHAEEICEMASLNWHRIPGIEGSVSSAKSQSARDLCEGFQHGLIAAAGGLVAAYFGSYSMPACLFASAGTISGLVLAASFDKKIYFERAELQTVVHSLEASALPKIDPKGWEDLLTCLVKKAKEHPEQTSCKACGFVAGAALLLVVPKIPSIVWRTITSR